jgi:hypothetical protein
LKTSPSTTEVSQKNSLAPRLVPFALSDRSINC